MAEPIKGGVEAGLRLGVGKAEEDSHYTAAENIVRKRLEVEVQADEDAARTARREVRCAATCTLVPACRWTDNRDCKHCPSVLPACALGTATAVMLRPRVVSLGMHALAEPVHSPCCSTFDEWRVANLTG